jgi:hypothetical protein
LVPPRRERTHNRKRDRPVAVIAWHPSLCLWHLKMANERMKVCYDCLTNSVGLQEWNGVRLYCLNWNRWKYLSCSFPGKAITGINCVVHSGPASSQGKDDGTPGQASPTSRCCLEQAALRE